MRTPPACSTARIRPIASHTARFAVSARRRLRSVEREILTATPGSRARPARTLADKARQKVRPPPGALVLARRRRRLVGLEERRLRLAALAARLALGLPPAAVARPCRQSRRTPDRSGSGRTHRCPP